MTDAVITMSQAELAHLQARIAELEQREAKLQQELTLSQERCESYRLLLDNAPIGLRINQEQRAAYINPTGALLFGSTVQEQLSLSAEEAAQYVHPDDLFRLHQYFRDRVAGLPTPNEYTFRLLRPDGSIRWMECHVTLAEFNHQPATFLAYFDITERKQTEERLRSSELRFRRLFEDAPIGIAIANANRQIMRVNRTFSALLHYSEAELLGLTAVDLTFPADLEREIQQFRLNEGKSQDVYQIEKRLIAKNGEHIWVHMTTTLLRNELGALDGGYAMIVDLRERKQQEAALMHYAQRLEALRQIDQAILDNEPEHHIAQLALAQLRTLLPCERASVVIYDHVQQQAILSAVNTDRPTHAAVGYVVRTLMHETAETLARIPDIIDDLAHYDSTLPIDALLLQEGLHAAVRAPMIEHEGPIGVLSVHSIQPSFFRDDMVEFVQNMASLLAIGIVKARLREAEQQAQQRSQALSEASQALSRRLVHVQENERRQIARELHDEIGQVLTGAGMLLDTLSLLPVEHQQQRIERIRTIMQDLIQRVRSLALDLRPAILDDKGLFAALVWMFRRFHQESGIQVVFQHSGIEQRFAAEIETAVYRIIQEALTNVARHAAIKRVHVHLHLHANWLVLKIQDHGKGFDLNQILERSDSVGLSSMRERALLLDGRFSIDSKQKSGTTIYVELPV
jgi:PAS domain S-box-containing protein